MATNFCSAPFSCRTVSGPSVTSTNQVDCGVCCCDPANDHCNKLSPNLYCAANRDQCTGAKRGLCCGCQRDDECGKYTNNGCGQDSCCRARASLKILFLKIMIRQFVVMPQLKLF